MSSTRTQRLSAAAIAAALLAARPLPPVVLVKRPRNAIDRRRLRSFGVKDEIRLTRCDPSRDGSLRFDQVERRRKIRKKANRQMHGRYRKAPAA